MLPFGVTIPVTVPQRSEIPEGLMNNPVYDTMVVDNKDRCNFTILLLRVRNYTITVNDLLQ